LSSSNWSNAHLGEDQAPPIGGQGFKGRGDDHDAADEGLAKRVVKLWDAGDGI
jgi:hypothetical protein